jgi:uncharacterized protein (TIGR02145 family)
MKKNLILMMLLLTGAVSVTAQVEIPEGPKMVIKGNMVNTGAIKSQIPIELRGENANVDNLSGGDIYTRGLLVGDGTLLTNYGTITVGEGPLVVDGVTYATGNFGIAGTWMTENLRRTTGVAENEAGTTTSTEKQYTHVNLDKANDARYGLLYNWYAATNGENSVTDEDQGNQPSQAQVQGICPTGWHLPTDYEWSQLEEVIAKDAVGLYSKTFESDNTTDFYTTTGYRGTNAGRKMKSTTVVLDEFTPNGSSNASNDDGFNGLLTGYVTGGNPQSYGSNAYYWSNSSNANNIDAIICNLHVSQDGVNRAVAFNKLQYISVRCKKN